MADSQEEKNSERHKRLLQVLVKLGFKNYAEFAKAISMSKSYVSEILKSQKPPKTMGQKLEDHLKVSRRWFEEGEGEMMSGPSPRLEAKPMRLADPEGYERTGEKIYELNDGSLMMEVPVVTQRAYAGYLRGFADPEFYEDLMTIPVMIDKRAFSTYMAFEVYGDSMVCLDDYESAEKSIFPGRIAVGRLLDQSKWQYKLHTHNYDAWIIVHKTEGILIKSITKHDVENGIITIHSLNPKYGDQDLKLVDVEQIFSVVKIEQKKR